jgi:hypothetical protein
MTEKEFCKVFEYICVYEHRRLWLKTGSFNEILAYLEGYADGAKVNKHGHHTYATPFKHWLAIKFTAKNDILSWNEYREIFPDEEDAIANLPILYKEFAESSYLENLGY